MALARLLAVSAQDEAQPGSETPSSLPETPPRLSLSRRIAGLKRPRLVRNAWFATRYFLGSHRLTYPLLKWAPAPYARVMVSAESEACIDGLPRSANTFGGLVFLEQNPGVALAHHMHLPAQFLGAVRLGVPTCVLIRRPVDNLASMAITADNDISHDLLFRTYLHYLGKIETVRDKVVLCTFDEVVAEPGIIARRLNEFFGTSFNAEPMTEERSRGLVDALGSDERIRPGHVPVPTAYKEDLKPLVKRDLSEHRLLPKAEALYERLAATAG